MIQNFIQNTGKEHPYAFSFEKPQNWIIAQMVRASKNNPDVYKVLNLVSNKEKGACNKNMQRMRKNGELREGEKYGTYKLRYNIDCYDHDGNIREDDNAPWIKAPGIDFEADKIESNH